MSKETDSETKPVRSDIPAMFRPPVNRAMRVLDRSFFKRTVPVSAATIFKTSDIATVRQALHKKRDLLALPRMATLRDIKQEEVVRKCLLLREEIKHDGQAIFSLM